MPTNVTSEYIAAENEFRKARTPEEKIKALKKMYAEVPKHKGTEKLIAEIKLKISKYRRLIEKEEKRKKRNESVIKKEGSAQIVIIGPTNSGKSLLLSKLTNAKPEIADYPFTTKKPIVGMMEYNGVKIQVIEVPAIYKGSSKNKSLFNIVRNCDLVVVLVRHVNEKNMVLDELKKANILLNVKKPDIVFRKTSSGGIDIIGKNLINISKKRIINILNEKGINNCVIRFNKKSTLNDLINSLNESLAYIKAIFVFNSSNSNVMDNFDFVLNDFGDNEIGKLKDIIWKKLGLIKVYTKEIGKKPMFDKPITLKKGSTVKDLAKGIHKDFVKKFKSARVWGKSVRFNGQNVGLDHVLNDGDVVEIYIK